MLVTEKMNWDDAKEKCKSQDSDLVSVRSEEENAALKEHLQDYFGGQLINLHYLMFLSMSLLSVFFL